MNLADSTAMLKEKFIYLKTFSSRANKIIFIGSWFGTLNAFIDTPCPSNRWATACRLCNSFPRKGMKTWAKLKGCPCNYNFSFFLILHWINMYLMIFQWINTSIATICIISSFCDITSANRKSVSSGIVFCIAVACP